MSTVIVKMLLFIVAWMKYDAMLFQVVFFVTNFFIYTSWNFDLKWQKNRCAAFFNKIAVSSYFLGTFYMNPSIIKDIKSLT